MRARLEDMLKGIDAASLKPRQKLVMLQHYAIPKLLYPLTQAHFPKKLDVSVRTYVRKWLKLPGSTCFPQQLSEWWTRPPRIPKNNRHAEDQHAKINPKEFGLEDPKAGGDNGSAGVCKDVFRHGGSQSA